MNFWKSNSWKPRKDVANLNQKTPDVALIQKKMVNENDCVYLPEHRFSLRRKYQKDKESPKKKQSFDNKSPPNCGSLTSNFVEIKQSKIEFRDNGKKEISFDSNLPPSHNSAPSNSADNKKPKSDTRKVSLVGYKKHSFVRLPSIKFNRKRGKSIVDFAKPGRKTSIEGLEKEFIKSIGPRLKRSCSNDSIMTNVGLRNDPHLEDRRTRAAVSVYVLDHLLAAKRIEMLENIYGGKTVANKAAKTIQRFYRRHLTKKYNVNLKSSTDGKIGYRSSTIDENKRKSRVWIENKPKIVAYDPNDPFDVENDPERKCLYQLGINLFNRSCNKGINFLIKNKILESNSGSICKFFQTKGLSAYAKGDFMSQDNSEIALETRRRFVADLSFHNCSIEKGIRQLFSFIRIPGETQKILNMLEDFREVYLAHNSEFEKELKTPDSVVLMAFTILMLHTSLFNPSARKNDRMSKEQFVSLFRHINDEPFITEAYLNDTYESIKKKQMKPLSDHTDLVRNISNHLTGPLVPKDLVQNHRKLVCQFNVNEIANIAKKPGNHAHNREFFLFNDILLVTKKLHNAEYQVRIVIPLLEVQLSTFQTEHYPCGVELRRRDQTRFVLYVNCFSAENRAKLQNDVGIFVDEVRQLENLRQQQENSTNPAATPSTAMPQ